MSDRILVTGAEGFIGSHLVEALVRQGRQVRAFVLYNSFDRRGWLDTLNEEVLGSVEVVLGDVRDRRNVLDAMRGCDSVFHLAALIAIPFSYQAPETFVDVNVKGTLNVVEAARELGVGKVVHTSTSEVYGSAQSVPITEAHPMVGQSPYAASKIGADQIALSFYLSFDTPVAVARPFNTYGPRQSLRAVIPTVLCQLLDGARSLQLGALAPRRDFNYVLDTVRGLIAIHDAQESVGEVINIGSGFDVSVADLVESCMEVVGRRVPVEEDGQRIRPARSEVMRLVCGNEKAANLLGWRPSYGGVEGLRKGLEQFAQWLEEPRNRAHYPDSGRYVL